VLSGIDIAHDFSDAIFRDQPGMRLYRALDSLRHDGGRWRFDLEGHSRVPDVRTIDCRDSGRVVFPRRSNTKLQVAHMASPGTIITALSLVMGLAGPLVGAVWPHRAPTVVPDQP
jgi:hypothetical protein